MNIVNRKVSELIPYGNNPRINDDAILKVAESIKNFGYKVPIVIDKNNIIVCGHTRHKALEYLNIEEVECIIADDLTEQQIKAFRLADNKVSEYSVWEDDLLMLELQDIIDINMTDFGFVFDEEDEKPEKEKLIKKMELKAFEHYDYLVFVFNNQHDFLNMATEFGIEKVDAGYTTRKIGIGRVIKGEELVKRIRHKDFDIE